MPNNFFSYFCRIQLVMSPTTKTISLICFVLGAIPLVPWPAIAIASLMGLAGHVSPFTPWTSLVIPRLFFLATLLYPVVYILAVVLYQTKKPLAMNDISMKTLDNRNYILLFYSLIPLIFLLFTILLGGLFFLTTA